MRRGLVVDLFAGGGGASLGLEAALGRPPDIAINHSAVALAVHAANHPRTVHLVEDIWAVSPRHAVGRRGVDVLWASPDCTHFSRAKGGKPRKHGTRSLAWAVVRWAREVRPRIIFLENVDEFRTWGPLDEHGDPIEARMGETFTQWRGALELLGYTVDFRVLDASSFGAPTKRRRLFLVARCDGEPIRWPEPTHGPGLLPFHTAAECIDWSLPCPSIFERKKPLAEKTLWRIAQGIRRFVLEAAEPFIVPMNADNAPMSVAAPLGTVTSQVNRFNLVVPTLIQTSYGERKGQAARVLDLHEPLGTVVAGGQKHSVVMAFLAKHYGGVVGQSLDQPIGTVTSRDHHGLVHVAFGGTDHTPEVRAFLTVYYGNPSDAGQSLKDPMRAVVTKDRLGLVTVAGVEHQIADISMRMLEPHELLRAQFGRFAADYDLSEAKGVRGKWSKSAAVRLIGNSVCPEVAVAVVAANVPAAMRRVA